MVLYCWEQCIFYKEVLYETTKNTKLPMYGNCGLKGAGKLLKMIDMGNIDARSLSHLVFGCFVSV